MTIPLFRLPRDARRLAARLASSPATADEATRRRVGKILADCKRRGGRAVADWTKRIDGVALAPNEFAVPRKAILAAEEEIPVGLARAIRLAWKRVFAYHKDFARVIARRFLRREAGIAAGAVPTPLRRVGIYVPGGSAPLFSTLLMAAAAARAAGVPVIIAATPPGPNGRVAPEIRFAAALAGVENLYRIGGVQAIAAFAHGAGPIEPVEKIAGPGNRWVVEAKRQVFGSVGIDSLAGPSEVVVVAEDRAAPGAGPSPEVLAYDLLAQAEHDADARAILLTPSRTLAEAVRKALAKAIPTLPRAVTARASLTRRGAIVVTRTISEAFEIADEIAPEHLILHLPWPPRSLPRAGAVFLNGTPEVLGDYLAGPNHILPTSGSARFASALSPLDFLRWPTALSVSPRGLARLAVPGVRLARAEGLEAHARAILARRP